MIPASCSPRLSSASKAVRNWTARAWADSAPSPAGTSKRFADGQADVGEEPGQLQPIPAVPEDAFPTRARGGRDHEITELGGELHRPALDAVVGAERPIYGDAAVRVPRERAAHDLVGLTLAAGRDLHAGVTEAPAHLGDDLPARGLRREHACRPAA